MTSLFIDSDDDPIYTGNDDSVFEHNDVTQDQTADISNVLPVAISTNVPEPLSSEVQTTESRPDLQVNVLTPFNFQRQILTELAQDDALLIMARGLGMSTITAHLLHILDMAGIKTDPFTGKQLSGATVILLGATSRENERINDEMMEIARSQPDANQRNLTVINVEKSNPQKRTKLYEQGGIFSITSQPLLIDMLSDTIDCSRITGIILINAHTAINTSGISFILRLFRQKNKYGFIKALSEQPESFVKEFNFQTYLKTLQVRKLMLWPRFHLQVVKDLVLTGIKKQSSEVVEIAVEMTEPMKLIQMILVDQMQKLSSQIRADNRDLISVDWSIDNALERRYSKVIYSSLQDNWYISSQTTRNFVSDLVGVENMLELLPSMDSVSFFEELKLLRSADGERPTWLDLAEGETLYSTAEHRASPNCLELQPKYEQLMKILDEINVLQQSPNSDKGPVLIMCREKRTVSDLQQYLRCFKSGNLNSTGTFFMRQKLKKHLALNEITKWINSKPVANNSQAGRNKTNSNSVRPNKRRRVRGSLQSAGLTHSDMTHSDMTHADVPELSITRVDADEREVSDTESIEIAQINEIDYFEIMESSDIYIIRQYDNSLDDGMLQELRPSFVIMYEADPAFIRRLEIYRKMNAPESFRPYFLYYTESIEEGRFLYEVRHEKDVFTKLIQEKAKLPTILNDEDDYKTGPGSLLRAINTRIAGGGMQSLNTGEDTRRVVVDAREFRSAKLPFILHQKGIEVIPVVLTVGDFVISPEICIERKSVNDLIASFADGRLYQQCMNMFRHYDMPILLVEFDTLPSTHNQKDLLDERIRQKLALLLLIFPKLRIIWSFSADHSAEIVTNLKLLRAEPDPILAAAIGTGTDDKPQYVENQEAVDTLLQIPGVNEANHHLIMQHYISIRDLSEASHVELEKLLGTESATRILTFFTQKPAYE